MALSFRLATEADIPALLELRLAVDADQERRFGDERWSTTISERSIARVLKSSRVVVASNRGRIVATARMETKKPWAIDLAYFTAIRLDAYDGRSGGGPFYRKCGFRELKRTVYRGVPLVYFELIL